jgi:EAL domain-containing protein (putative c-di-GMP-specific phosphodiesterase class I)
VIAEGVETERQLDALARLECDFAQGYLFSRPMPAHDLVEKFPLPLGA